MKTLVLICLTNFFLLSSLCDIEQGWKGIRVLNSNRRDVEEKLGKPVSDESGEVRYETPEAHARVLYSIGPCVAADTVRGGYDVKEGTVVQYEVQPKNLTRFDELKWDKSRYESDETSHQVGVFYYFNPQDGILIVAQKITSGSPETIRTMYFQRPKELESKYRCKPTK
jgi:hypothetical protein